MICSGNSFWMKAEALNVSLRSVELVLSKENSSAWGARILPNWDSESL